MSLRYEASAKVAQSIGVTVQALGQKAINGQEAVGSMGTDTPLAVLSAVNRAASLNIIVKSGAAIEQAGRAMQRYQRSVQSFDCSGTTVVCPRSSRVPLGIFSLRETVFLSVAISSLNPIFCSTSATTSE